MIPTPDHWSRPTIRVGFDDRVTRRNYPPGISDTPIGEPSTLQMVHRSRSEWCCVKCDGRSFRHFELTRRAL